MLVTAAGKQSEVSYGRKKSVSQIQQRLKFFVTNLWLQLQLQLGKFVWRGKESQIKERAEAFRLQILCSYILLLGFFKFPVALCVLQLRLADERSNALVRSVVVIRGKNFVIIYAFVVPPASIIGCSDL